MATSTASWQDVGYRCPRPGFFLGDDGSMANASVLLDDAKGTLPPSCDLGRLGVLPLELLQQIVADLAESDVRALVALRNCNRAAAAVVESVRDFATVAAFPRALGALVRLAPDTTAKAAACPLSDSVSPVSVRALAACLRTTACANCLRQGKTSDTPYGDYIYLLAPERVCYACFRSQPEYLPVARFASASSQPIPQGLHGKQHLTSIRVPPARYGVLARLTQPVDLFDRRQVYAEEASTSSANVAEDSSSAGHSHTVKRGPSVVPGKPTRPDPLRYAAVIPGPYWVRDDKDEAGGMPTLDRGYACRACAQTDHKSAGHAGWADPLILYTKEGLERHVADPRFGGRVLRRRDPRTGADLYEHDAPRRGHFPPPVEFGATADLARRYEAVVLVPEGSVVGTRL